MDEVTGRGPVPVEVRPAKAPDGRVMVLLQLPDGYALMTPDDADVIAGHLQDVAFNVREGLL